MTDRPKKLLTLVLVRDGRRVLLGMKKRGFGAGRWNGFGGKLHPGETVLEAAHRETREEAGIDIRNPELCGIVEFEFAGSPEILEIHFFRVAEFDGEPVETEEMRPKWFYFDEIPFAEMWPDDALWFPLFARNKKFRGRILFEGHDVILEHTLEVVDEFYLDL
ncbi:MAG: 8-oxo-dGTP diphosphatase [Patescibacteria group bacterium]